MLFQGEIAVRFGVAAAMRLAIGAVLSSILVAPVALANVGPIRFVSHQVWRTNDGLPQNTISGIAEGPDGYLWLGTQSGLARFDGVNFRTFDRGNTPAMKSNDIRAVIIARDGTVWAGTYGGGVMHLANNKVEVLTTRDGLANDIIYSLHQSRDGAIWIGTAGGGVNRLKDGKLSVLTTKDGLPSDRVFTIAEERNGDLWFGTLGGGAVRLRNGKLQRFGKEEGLLGAFVFGILSDRKGTVWAATYDAGLFRLDGDRFVRVDGLPYDQTSTVYEDRRGDLWVGTFRGVNRIRNGRVERFDSNHGLAGDVVRTIREDREGSIWIGTFDGGLTRLTESTFTTYRSPEVISHDVSTVFQQRDGTMWFGSESRGLARSRGGEMTTFSVAESGMTSNSVLALWSDEQSLWIGTFGGGLMRLRDEKITSYTTNDGLPSNSVYAIYETRDGTLWVGTNGGGIARREGERFRAFGKADGLSDLFIRCLTEDRQGNLWIGTNGGGLNRLRDGTISSFTTKHGLSNGIVTSLHEDGEGTLWIGTRGGGLNRLDGDRFTAFTTRDGMFDDVILQILEDDLGRLWMSTPKGVFMVEKHLLTAASARPIPVKAFGTADGMVDSQCNGGSQPAGWKSKDGRLWFATMRGVVVADPREIRGSLRPPPVYLDQVVADGQIRAMNPHVTLPAGTRNLEIHYTGISYIAPERMKFRYRLEGFDDHWNDVGPRRVAYYTRIPPGEYRFNVIAANKDGVWNQRGASTVMIVEPFVYQRGWFQALMAGLILALALLAYIYRTAHLRHEQKMLSTQVYERTRELAEANERLQRLTAIDGLTGIANRREFDRFLDVEWRRLWDSGEPLSVLLGDIDYFKSYNDSYGHQQGDDCLRSVAAALEQCVSRASDLVARYGGEEFGVILSMTNVQSALAMAELMRERVAALDLPHQNGIDGRVTISFGVATVLPRGGETAAKLLNDADQALYRAKNEGRNRVVVASS